MAKDNGFQPVQLPMGKYLIDKNNAISFCDNTTYGLYNCIFIKESNNLPKYNILLCDGKLEWQYVDMLAAFKRFGLIEG
ncbi:hypothetical protein [Bacillus hominis]|uniref:hypothetical protein n=1 Tax=Bacillus hominis TaxID=2817478 RepID=UPI001BB32A03|nr:hypothetical protein [Bacillus hominis]